MRFILTFVLIALLPGLALASDPTAPTAEETLAASRAVIAYYAADEAARKQTEAAAAKLQDALRIKAAIDKAHPGCNFQLLTLECAKPQAKPQDPPVPPLPTKEN